MQRFLRNTIRQLVARVRLRQPVLVVVLSIDVKSVQIKIKKVFKNVKDVTKN